MTADIWQDNIDEALAMFAERGQRNRIEAIRLDVSDRDAFAATADPFDQRIGSFICCATTMAWVRAGASRCDIQGLGLGVMLGATINGLANFVPHGCALRGRPYLVTSSMAGVLQPVMRGGITYATARPHRSGSSGWRATISRRTTSASLR